MTQQNNNGKSTLDERETIRYQWMLARIQSMKALLVATLLAMVGYVASSVGESHTYCEISLLSVSAVLLVIALVLAAIDAGAALFYNEKSQEGISKKTRLAMYILIVFAAVAMLSAKITRGVSNIETQNISRELSGSDCNSFLRTIGVRLQFFFGLLKSQSDPDSSR